MSFTLIFIPILFYPITLEGRRGTTDAFATIPFHLDRFSAALVELAKSIPVHSLILSSHLFFCLPLFLFPFTVPYLSTFRNFHGGDSGQIDVSDPFFFTTKRWENLLEFPWGRHFSYLQSGLDITIKTFVSRIINGIILQTNAFINKRTIVVLYRSPETLLPIILALRPS